MNRAVARPRALNGAARPATRTRDFLVRVVFPAPALLAILALLVFPTAYNAYMSLFNWYISNPAEWVGLGNYAEMFLRDERFWGAVARTGYLTVLTVPPELALGTAIAVLLRQSIPGSALLRVLFMLPMVATPVAMALVWSMLLTPTGGLLNHLLEQVGVPPSLWATHPDTVMPSLALVDIWQWTPMVTLIVLAGLESLPREPFEAAVIDGASPWQGFRAITLPLLQPALAVAAMFRTIDGLKNFDVIYVITQGGPGTSSETLNVYIYQTGFNYLHLGYSSALIMVLLALVFGTSLILSGLRKRSWRY
jgi:multiple sugar transport system permease protein